MKFLVEDFSLVDGQSPIPRIAREYGMFVKHIRVEIYPMALKLGLFSDSETSYPASRKFSRADKIATILIEARKMFKTEETKSSRLWAKFSTNVHETLFNLEETLEDAGIFTGQTIMMEVQNEDGTWPRDRQ